MRSLLPLMALWLLAAPGAVGPEVPPLPRRGTVSVSAAPALVFQANPGVPLGPGVALDASYWLHPAAEVGASLMGSYHRVLGTPLGWSATAFTRYRLDVANWSPWMALELGAVAGPGGLPLQPLAGLSLGLDRRFDERHAAGLVLRYAVRGLRNTSGPDMVTILLRWNWSLPAPTPPLRSAQSIP